MKITSFTPLELSYHFEKTILKKKLKDLTMQRLQTVEKIYNYLIFI